MLTALGVADIRVAGVGVVPAQVASQGPGPDGVGGVVGARGGELPQRAYVGPRSVGPGRVIRVKLSSTRR